jgi:tRNA threonylcarbamoyladenosine biosynthesis protein TsaE
MIWQTISTDSADTERLGELLGRLLKPPAVIELKADLGGGKTKLTRGLVHGLGSKNTVSSPTFTINKIYKAKNVEIHHYDFYRLPEPGIVADQLEESLHGPNTIVIVEWGGSVDGVLPKDRISIELLPTANNPDERAIKISYPESMSDVLKQLETSWSESKA